MAISAEPGRSTASRLFAILGAFERGRSVMTLTQLSQATGMPIATTFRIVRELVASGAVERNDNGSFQIGLRLWEIGTLAPRQRDLRRTARPVMDALHERTRETVQFVVPDTRWALCIEKVSGSRAVSNVTEVGGRLPLHASGVGKVVLAFGGPEFDVPPTQRLRRFTPYTVVDPARLAEQIARVRRDGVATCREELTLGTVSTAAPVFDSRAQFIGAIGVMTGSPTNLARLEPVVREAAAAVSARLGYRATVPQGALA